jgi:hypothetical protein
VKKLPLDVEARVGAHIARVSVPYTLLVFNDGSSIIDLVFREDERLMTS